MATCFMSHADEQIVPLCEPACPQRLAKDANDVDCKKCLDIQMGVLIDKIQDLVWDLKTCRERVKELDAKRLKGGE